MRPPKRVLDLYVAHSISIGLVVSGAGVLLLVLAGLSNDTASVVLATVGGAVLTIAVLSVINDAFLKDIFIRDVFAAIGLQASVRDAGLQWIKRTSSVTPADWLNDTTTVHALPLNAVEFRKTELRPIAEAAAERSLSLAIFVPDPKPPHVDALAFALNEDPARMATDLKAVDGDLVRAWAAAPLAKGSTIRIYRFEGLPSCGLIATDTLLLLEVMPAVQFPLTGRDSWTFAFSLDAGPARLLMPTLDAEQASQINEWPQPPPPQAAPAPAAAAGGPATPPDGETTPSITEPDANAGQPQDDAPSVERGAASDPPTPTEEQR